MEVWHSSDPTREYHVDSTRFWAALPCFHDLGVNVGRVNKVEVEVIGDRCLFLSVDTSCTIPLYGKGLLIAELMKECLR